MLLQTNAYSVPTDKRDSHARLTARLQEAMRKIGATLEVYEQVGPGFSPAEESTGRYVQVMRFRDRRHLANVQAAERNDVLVQTLLAEFVQLIGLPEQANRGTYLPGYYSAVTATEGA